MKLYNIISVDGRSVSWLSQVHNIEGGKDFINRTVDGYNLIPVSGWVNKDKTTSRDFVWGKGGRVFTYRIKEVSVPSVTLAPQIIYAVVGVLGGWKKSFGRLEDAKEYVSSVDPLWEYGYETLAEGVIRHGKYTIISIDGATGRFIGNDRP